MKFKIERLGIVLFLVFSCLAMAGNEGGAGGDGVLLNGKVYSLDLVEAGIENRPYFDFTMESHPAFARIEARVKKAFRLMNEDQVSHLVAVKILEVSQLDPVFAWSLIDTIEAYSWRLVIPALIEVDDEDPVVNLANLKTVQLAVRRIQAITINRELWSRTELSSKVALIFHEIIYALIRPEWISVENLNPAGERLRESFYKQSSPRSRQIVATLFTESLNTSEARKNLTSLIGSANLGFASDLELYLPFTGTKYEVMAIPNCGLQFDPSLIFQVFQGSYSWSPLGISEIKLRCRDKLPVVSHFPTKGTITERALYTSFQTLPGKGGRQLSFRGFQAVSSEVFNYEFTQERECLDRFLKQVEGKVEMYGRHNPFN